MPASARGWAIWKALIALAQHRDKDPDEASEAHRVIREVIDNHCRTTITAASNTACKIERLVLRLAVTPISP